MPEAGIIIGRDSDLPKVKKCFSILENFGVKAKNGKLASQRYKDFITVLEAKK